MAIPDFQTLMLPVLKALKDGQEHPFRNIVELLALEFNLTQDELSQMLPSRRAPTFYNRVAWAKFYLKKAKLVSQVKRSYLSITPRGQKVLADNPSVINIKFLEQFSDFILTKDNESIDETSNVVTNDDSSSNTPEEVMENSYQKLNILLASELLEVVKSCTPQFFERLVVEVLLAMGYGGSRVEAGRAIGQSGDGGIDGIIDEDKLGLDSIYIQAKRWEGSVGRPEIQKFVGALQGQRAHKGVFITTSDFTKDAQEYVRNISSKVVLINGFTLARLMIENNVGVSTVSTYEVKKIDTDYFVDE
ncbi:restriction endonuclease [Methylobacillus sp.]|uniref:restriction endonuclease n=1 Tax=Methylobacillus sp. TaxID=56818 RepID=UPI002FE18E74